MTTLHRNGRRRVMNNANHPSVCVRGARFSAGRDVIRGPCWVPLGVCVGLGSIGLSVFDRVSSSLIQFHWLGLGFTRLYWALPALTGFDMIDWVLLGFIGEIYWVVLSFTGFYWVLLDFYGF